MCEIYFTDYYYINMLCSVVQLNVDDLSATDIDNLCTLQFNILAGYLAYQYMYTV